MTTVEARMGAKGGPGFVPVIVIGAGRSGTKILRDALCSLPGAGTWACDEINNIWRHGNALTPHDELERRDVSPGVAQYIRQQFGKLAASGPHSLVIEKTCANALRVGFVDEILPTAKFVHLVRDGRDVTASALHRWRGNYSFSGNRSYMSAKLRHVPPSDLPVYTARLARNVLHRRFSNDQRAAHWGPRLEDLGALLRQHPLDEVCALQWQRCLERAGEDLAELSSERVFELRYEDLVAEPAVYLQKMGDFLEVPVGRERAAGATAGIDDRQVGQAARTLESDQLARVENIIGPTLSRYGYV